MKDFIYKIAIFIPVAAVAVAVGIALLGGTGLLRNVSYNLGMWDYTHTKVREASEYKDIDVLFVGSSHCYRTFDTRFYAAQGLRTFNFGTSNQTPLQTLMLLRLYLDRLSPRVVVIEVHPDLMCNDGVESSLYLANNMKPSFELARMAFATRNLKSVLTMVYSATHNTLSKEFAAYNDPSTDDENKYVAGGFVESNGGLLRPEPLEEVGIEMNARQLDALRKCAKLLRRRGIPFLLVEVPASETLERAYRGHDAFVDEMRKIGEYHSPQPEGLCDTIHYYDLDHLNQQGVELFNPCFYHTVLKPFIEDNQRL